MLKALLDGRVLLALFFILSYAVVILAANPAMVSPNGNFRLFAENVRHSTAQQRCTDFSGILATIKSAQDQQEVDVLVTARGKAWIGGKVVDDAVRRFAWGDGQLISEGNWPSTCLQNFCNWMAAGNEPNNNHELGETAMEARKLGWNDFPQSVEQQFICQYCAAHEHRPLDTRVDGGNKFKNVSISSNGKQVVIRVQPENGAGYVVGPPVDQLESSSLPFGKQLVALLWPNLTEQQVASSFHQPPNGLAHDSSSNCVLTMQRPVGHFCGPHQDSSGMPTHTKRVCNVTLCKLYAADKLKTQLRVATCSAIKFELRFAKSQNEQCDETQSSGVFGCAPTVHIWGWSTNEAGTTTEFRALPSAGELFITNVECESNLMDCSGCFVTEGATFRCLAKNTTGSHTQERVTMKITAMSSNNTHGCPDTTTPKSCTSILTHTATITQRIRQLTVHNYHKFALTFPCNPGHILALSRTDLLTFELIAMESAQLRITKVMLIGESETFDVFADKEQFDLTTNTTLLFEPEGILVANVGDQIVCSFSAQSLSTTKPLESCH